MGLTVFVGSVATSNMDKRYLLTSVPLLVAGGLVALHSAWSGLTTAGGGDSAASTRDTGAETHSTSDRVTPGARSPEERPEHGEQGSVPSQGGA